jgi:hypothetical protein
MAEHLIPLENQQGYAKDLRSSAYVNTDLAALTEYKQKKKNAKILEDMKNEINMLKEELAKIKSHLNLS